MYMSATNALNRQHLILYEEDLYVLKNIRDLNAYMSMSIVVDFFGAQRTECVQHVVL